MIDKNEAPEGYIAELAHKPGCHGCAFRHEDVCEWSVSCLADERQDHQYVIFVKKDQALG